MKKYIPFTVFLIPFIFFGYYFSHALNIPCFDEYRVVIQSFLQYQNSKGLKDLLSYVLQPENESIQVFLKLFTVLSHTLTGSIHFKWGMVLGNAFLFGIGVIHWQVLKENSLEKGLLPAILFLSYFTFQFQDQILRIDVPWYYFTGIFFSLLSIYSLSQKRTLYAIVFFVLAILGNASSILLLPVLLFYSFLQKNRSAIVIYTALAIFILPVFLLSSKAISDVPNLNVSAFLTNFLMVLGAFTYMESFGVEQKLFSFISGCILFILYFGMLVQTFLATLKKKAKGLDVYVFLFSSFWLISIAAIVFKRHGNAVEFNPYLTHSRYAFLGLQLFPVAVIHYGKFLTKPVQILGLLATLCFWMLSFIENDQSVKYLGKLLRLDAVNYPKNGMVIHDPVNTVDIRKSLNQIPKSNAFYTFPRQDELEEMYEQHLHGNLPLIPTIKVEKELLEPGPGIPPKEYLEMEIPFSGQESKLDGLYIYLISENQKILYPSTKTGNVYKQFMLNNIPHEDTFYSRILTEFIPKGTYQIFVAYFHKNQISIFATEKEITF